MICRAEAMPRVSGLEFLTAAKQRGCTTPIVVVTADIQESTREQCLALGATAVINKPSGADDLNEVVHLDRNGVAEVQFSRITATVTLRVCRPRR